MGISIGTNLTSASSSVACSASSPRACVSAMGESGFSTTSELLSVSATLSIGDSGFSAASGLLSVSVTLLSRIAAGFSITSLAFGCALPETKASLWAVWATRKARLKPRSHSTFSTEVQALIHEWSLSSACARTTDSRTALTRETRVQSPPKMAFRSLRSPLSQLSTDIIKCRAKPNEYTSSLSFNDRAKLPRELLSNLKSVSILANTASIASGVSPCGPETTAPVAAMALAMPLSCKLKA
mmetsp:Transcript_66847/g.126439  ORF Transcript_66847/g.126439 Transcript_66847/m.126439 type:complete len:241 (+) Transcript_66847:1729-2451(+)